MPKVKICGITNSLDYSLASDLGADYTGFIFYPGSSRFVSVEQATSIIKHLNSSSLNVGVFVNERIPLVQEAFQTAQLDIVQLHGDESPEYCRQLALPYWKAIRIDSQSAIQQIDHFRNCRILLDSGGNAHHPYGGSGSSIPKDLLNEALEYPRQFMVAGGMSVDNLDILNGANVYGIDLCSSVESAPGRKDREKLISLFKKINQMKENRNEEL
mgnify:CR=1 FL=1